MLQLLRKFESYSMPLTRLGTEPRSTKLGKVKPLACLRISMGVSIRLIPSRFPRAM